LSTSETDNSLSSDQAETLDQLQEQVRRALEEDLGSGDRTSELTVPANLRAKGKLSAKQELVVAGLPVAELVFRQLETAVNWQGLAAEGDCVAAGDVLAEVEGGARKLLSAERVALNFLQHLSGIATLTRKFAEQIKGTRAELRDTRKTLPGLRALEKYAVVLGGGRNHRMQLDDGILIKSNHIRLAGGLTEALRRSGKETALSVEVEVTSLDELREAAEAGAGLVLLDNMTPDEVGESVRWVEGRPGERVALEVSGGVNLENIRQYADTGVDYIAVGALTHSAPAADIHFRMEPA
jgi:nicotinate-nucleotide pyrophosphorylase (carboxylating)